MEDELKEIEGLLETVENTQPQAAGSKIKKVGEHLGVFEDFQEAREKFKTLINLNEEVDHLCKNCYFMSITTQ